MKKRGKILRDTSSGAGLVSISGQQHPFELENVWRSDTAPRLNAVVDVELSEEGQIVSIVIVPESQLATEQATEAFDKAKEKGAAIAVGLAAKFGIETIVGMAALGAGWFFLTLASIKLFGNVSSGMTFWQVLSALNSPMGLLQAAGGQTGSTGIYGFFGAVCFLGPLLRFFWQDARAHLAGLLPLGFMLIVGLMVYLAMRSGAGDAEAAASAFGGRDAARVASEMASAMAKEMMKAITIGFGAYLSFGVSVYFAGKSLIRFLAAKA